MNNQASYTMNSWYWFITAVFKCDQASVIRCFFAPIYLPYINSSHNDEVDLIDVQKEWLDYCEEKVAEINIDNVRKNYEQDNIKNRIKYFGKYLCESIEREKGIECYKYLGKNRNVAQFPERFVQSIFPPNTQKGAFEELWSYYYQLLCQVFLNNKKKTDDILNSIEEINKIHFNVPEIISESKDESLNKIDRISHLICSFCLLSSSLRVEEDDKNGLLLHDSKHLYLRAQNYLEINASALVYNDSKCIKMSIEDLIILNVQSLDSKSVYLLKTINKINKDNIDALSVIKQQQVIEIVNSLIEAERQIINMMNNQEYEISKGLLQLNALSEMENFWNSLTEK